MRYTGKPLARKAIKMLDKSLGSFVDSAWDVKHRQWVASELAALAAKHGLPTGGEGVAKGAIAGNINESTPQGNFSQCDSGNATSYQIPSGNPFSINEPSTCTMTVSEPVAGPQTITVSSACGTVNDAKLWPTEALLTIQGYCPNPKLLRATLEDGSLVSMHCGARNWRVGDKAPARLTQGGGSPIYTAV